VDASKPGTKIKDGKNQKTVLSTEEEDTIISTFNTKQTVEDLSIAVSYDDITAKNYSLSAGQYFDVKVEHVEITPEEFAFQLDQRQDKIQSLFQQSREMEQQIETRLKALKLQKP
jgi:type I restriction enzyme M protein